jgi:hypothetical protein
MKKLKLTLLVLLVLLAQFTFFCFEAKADGELWLSGYSYRRGLPVTNSSQSAGTNYQMRLVVKNGTSEGYTQTYIPNDTLTLNNKVRADFGDINYTDNGGSTCLDYWIENGTLNSGINATFWVEVSGTLTATNQIIYIYYGKAGQTTYSNGDNTFRLFDDFSGSSLDGGKWSSGGSGTITVSGGTLDVTSSTSAKKYVNSLSIYATGVAVESRWKEASTNAALNYLGMTTYVGDDHDIYRTALEIYSGWTGYYWVSGNGVSNAAAYTGLVKDAIYHRHSVKRTGTLDHFAIDEAYTATGTYPTSTNRYVDIVAYPVSNIAGHIIVDWIAVRKYVSPEPSFGNGGAQEQPVSANIVALTSPTTDSTITVPTVIFNYTPFIYVGTILNSTLYLWNSPSGSLFSNSDYNASAIVNGSVNGIVHDFANSGSGMYAWNVLLGLTNGTVYQASANWSMIVSDTEAPSYSDLSNTLEQATYGELESNNTKNGYFAGNNVNYATSNITQTAGIGGSNSDPMYLGQQYGIITTVYSRYRAYLFFDTSSLTATSIYMAEIWLYASSSGSYLGTNFNITIQDGQPTFPHDPLYTNILDYSDPANDYYPANYAGDGGTFDTTNWNATSHALNVINLTETSWINKDGLTKLCLRSDRDINSNTPTGNEYLTLDNQVNYCPQLIVNKNIFVGVAGQPYNFSSLWNDNFNMSVALFQTNNTGSMQNNTLTFDPWTMTTTAWANYTMTLTTAPNVYQVLFMYLANDSSNNWNSTVFYIIMQAAVTANNYIIDLSLEMTSAYSLSLQASFNVPSTFALASNHIVAPNSAFNIGSNFQQTLSFINAMQAAYNYIGSYAISGTYDFYHQMLFNFLSNANFPLSFLLDTGPLAAVTGPIIGFIRRYSIPLLLGFGIVALCFVVTLSEKKRRR